jgi:hypothetical protein
MKPVTPESTAPMAKPTATEGPRNHATMMQITTPTPPMVVYCRFR